MFKIKFVKKTVTWPILIKSISNKVKLTKVSEVTVNI